MITLGVVLLLLGFLFGIPILWSLGMILLDIGIVLWILGAAGREIGQGRHHLGRVDHFAAARRRLDLRPGSALADAVARQGERTMVAVQEKFAGGDHGKRGGPGECPESPVRG